MNNKKSYSEFLEEFKVMLVKRYQWSVSKASQYNSEELKKYFEEGMDKHESYFKIFKIESDLQS